jgi:hypothetical protein
MSLVLDASVALKWFVQEDGAAPALALAASLAAFDPSRASPRR